MYKSKTKIVIASVLKPVDDVRNYEKMATSLVKNEKYLVTILGTYSIRKSSQSQIIFRSWYSFHRLSLGRIGIQLAYRRILISIKPDLIICTTFELLLVSVLFRTRHKVKIVYDIQEDYLKNLWFQKLYPYGFRHLLGLGIRALEFLLSPLISGFTLAEKTYQEDICFVRRKSLILENKSLRIFKEKRGTNFEVIFTGTVSSYSRAKECIELYLQVKNQLPESNLTVMGYVPISGYKNFIESKFGNHPNIKLRLSNTPVPHHEIIDVIAMASLAIIGYIPNPVNMNKVPTKLYEYTSAKLPYLVQSESHWANLGVGFGGAIPIRFEDPNSTDIMSDFEKIGTDTFVFSGFLWKENEADFLQFISDIIN